MDGVFNLEMQRRDWLIPLEVYYGDACKPTILKMNFWNLNASLSVKMIDPHMLFPSIPTTCTLSDIEPP